MVQMAKNEMLACLPNLIGSMDCLLERSYHAQTHKAAVDPYSILLSVLTLVGPLRQRLVTSSRVIRVLGAAPYVQIMSNCFIA